MDEMQDIELETKHGLENSDGVSFDSEENNSEEVENIADIDASEPKFLENGVDPASKMDECVVNESKEGTNNEEEIKEPEEPNTGMSDEKPPTIQHQQNASKMDKCVVNESNEGTNNGLEEESKESAEKSNPGMSGGKQPTVQQQQIGGKAVPPKKPATAYFMFLRENREKVKEDNPDLGIGPIGKLLGKMWAELGTAEKERFSKLAEEDKERYAREVNAQKASGTYDPNQGKKQKKTNKDPHPAETTKLILPLARIRKTCRLDPEVDKISKEGLQLISKATELFLAWLAENSLQQGTKSIKSASIARVVRSKEELAFLKDEFVDAERSKSKTKKVGTSSKKAKISTPADTPQISSFFQKS